MGNSREKDAEQNKSAEINTDIILISGRTKKTKNPHKAGSVNYQFQAYLLRLLPSSRL